MPKKFRPADWKTRTIPIPYSEAPPKRDLRPTAPQSRVPRRSEIEKRKVIAKPRPLHKAKKVPGRQRLATLTAEYILAGWAAGKSNGDMAAELGCTRGAVYKRAMIARAGDPAFVAAEAELKVCHCGGRKYAELKECSRCSARTGTGGTERQDITIPLVVGMLKAGKNIRVIAKELKADRKLIQRRVHAGQAHPEFGPALKAMGTCTKCGHGKFLHAGSLCHFCAKGIVRPEARLKR